MKLSVLGFSEATLSMILDSIESKNLITDINVINNLNITPKHEFNNPKFKINLIEEVCDFENQSFIIGVTNSKFKKQIYESFGFELKHFITLIHQFSFISTTSSVGLGCLINPFVSIASHTTIGNHVSINRNSSIGHHTNIGDFVTINPGVNIAGHVIIGDGTTIGMGANVINGISVGKNSIIGAGSLVNKDIPDNTIAWGSPCQIIKKNEA